MIGLEKENHDPEITAEITAALLEWSGGDASALDMVITEVYKELKKTARGYLDGLSPSHTLQPTALINEVYLRLRGTKNTSFSCRAQFFGFAGQLMRRILVDYIRARQTGKRGAGEVNASLEGIAELSQRQDLEPATLIALDQALLKLERIDPRQSRVVELRFFAGLSLEEIKEVVGLSKTTIKREWRLARLWLARELHAS